MQVISKETPHRKKLAKRQANVVEAAESVQLAAEDIDSLPGIDLLR